MSSWNTIYLGKLIDKGEANLQTGPFGTQLKASEYVEKGIPVINVKNIGFGDIRDSNLDFIDEKTAHRLRVHRLKAGDIVFGRKGSADRHALIGAKSDGWIQGSDCMRLRLMSDHVTPKFLSYYFCTSGHKYWMEAVCAFGATMSTLNQGIVRRITLRVPSVEVQNKITAVLSTYDLLIDKNKNRISYLEKLAEEIYREWFVQFRFPGREKVKFIKGLPSTWSVKKFREIANFTMGQSPPSSTYNESGEGLPFHQGVGSYGNRFPHNVTYCNAKGRKAKKGDILFSVRAPVGRLNIADCELIIGRGLASISHKEGHNSYLFYLLKVVFAKEDIIGNGSIFNSVGKDELAKFQVLQPEDDLVSQFQSFASSIDKQIEILSRSVETLSKTRDLLLPRLVSGKYPVEDYDIQFQPGMVEEASTQ